MAQLNANTVYLTLDGVDLGAYWKLVTMTPANEIQDVTAGSATTHREYLSGLDNYTFEITLVYDSTSASLQSYIQKLKPGAVVSLEWGPESNVSGKPRHVQDVIIEEAPFEVSVEKAPVAFAVKATGTGAPSVNIMAGGVYS